MNFYTALYSLLALSFTAGTAFTQPMAGLHSSNALKVDNIKSQTAKTAAPTLVAQQSRTLRIRFAPGKDSATIKESVIRGTRDIYLLNAQQGQTMIVKIVSLENNAVFDVAAPPNRVGQRRSLKREAISWSGTLPQTGDYQIVIGTTRGNASYRLQVTVR